MGFDEESEWKIIWLENHFDMDKVMNILESCDKECHLCSDKEECMLEMRESIHSIARTMKEMMSYILGAKPKPEPVDERPKQNTMII